MKFYLIAGLALFAVIHSFMSSHAIAADTIEVTIYTQKGERMFHLETALAPSERERGLMNRDTLAPNEGMLFVFPEVKDHAFWMKNTRIPLDMIFINAEDSVVAVESNATPQSLNPRRSGKPIRAVIELDGGRAARESIAPGDKVRYVLPQGKVVQ